MIINDIMIVGGGSSGWMTAALLLKEFPNKNITLIESPNIQTVGVGESTLLHIRRWSSLLGIDDRDFLPHTDGNFKLSLRFKDFYLKGDDGFHYPFGDGDFENNVAGYNDWYLKKALYPDTSCSDLADCIWPTMAMVNQNKLFYNDDVPPQLPDFRFDRCTAYQFDATKFGLWLRDFYCIPRGLTHIKEHIDTIEQDENGIKSLNNKHKADLYIDCTGFSSVLFDKTLNVPFEDYSHMLINNSAWATKIPYKNKAEQLVLYTNNTAIDNGWVWEIPLWSRMGAGYVYSNKFIDDDSALEQFKNWLSKKKQYAEFVKNDELEYKKIPMRIGIHERLWEKNVVAMGLAAAFVEPLQSTGLFTVQEFGLFLVRELQRGRISQWDRDNYTFACKMAYRELADFVSLDYVLSHRDDTEYWKHYLNKEWENSLINLIPKYHVGFFVQANRRRKKFEYFLEGGIPPLAAGMNYGPTDYPTMRYYNFFSEKEAYEQWNPHVIKLNEKKKRWNEIVSEAPNLYDFMKTHYYHE